MLPPPIQIVVGVPPKTLPMFPKTISKPPVRPEVQPIREERDAFRQPGPKGLAQLRKLFQMLPTDGNPVKDT